MLADCLTIHRNIVNGNAADLELFKSLLKQRELKFKSSTPILTNIVKLAFGDCGRRTEIYSYALQHASKKEVAPVNFPQWVADNGGVERITELKFAKKADKLPRTELIRLGEKALEGRKALAVLPYISELQPGQNAYFNLSLALIRRTPQQTYELIHGTAKASIISDVLVALGVEEATRHADFAISEPNKTQVVTQRLALQEAVASHQSTGGEAANLSSPSAN